MLRRSPGFALTVVLTLALGIGANTAIFTVVNAVLLRSLPFRDPSRLVALWDTFRPNYPKLGVSPAEYVEWARQSDIFEDVGRYRYVATGKEMNLTGGAEPLRVQPTCVSSSLFETLGVHARLGRTFTAADDAPNGPRIAILSDRLWRDYFHADPQVVGAPIQLNGQAFTVVGVMGPDFRLPSWADLWLPQGQAGDEISNPVRHAFGVVARLRPNVTERQARARLGSIGQRLEREHPSTSKGFGFSLASLQQDLPGNVRPALLLLLGAAGMVLLVACVNVANLLLSRAATRQHEMAIRVALGAGRWRIVRESLAESLRLSLAGGAAGLLLAYVGLELLLRLVPTGWIDRTTAVHVDAATLGFLFVVSMLAGMLFGIAPAVQAARQDPQEALKEGGRTFSRGSGAGRGALVVAEFALALLLLMGAGLLLHSFARLVNVQPGFEAHNVLTLRMQLQVSVQDYANGDKLKTFYERLEARLRSLPGVKAVAAANALPLMATRANMQRFSVPGSPLIHPDALPVAQRSLITPDYFRALGIPLIAGRAYTARDLNQPYIIINETLARTFWPDENPVGKRFITGPWTKEPTSSTIIGVVGDVKQYGLDSEQTDDFYYLWYGPTYLVIQTAGDPLALAPAVRREIHALAPDVALSDFRTMDQIAGATTGPRRFLMMLLVIFAFVALVLALVGIYGIMSWSVAQRTQEIGIRVAVGSDARGILRLILGRGLKLAAIGLAIGLGATLALTRVLASQLFETSPYDPWVLIAVSALMLAVTAAACYLPARRATKVDPIAALRAE